MKIGVKLTLTFFSIAFLSMLTVGIISYYRAKTSLEEESFNRLTAVREMKGTQITNYFSQIKNQLVSLAHNPLVIEATQNFKASYKTIGEELKVSEQELLRYKSDVLNYLDTVTLQRLNKNLDSKLSSAQLFSDNTASILLQHGFMVQNPFPTEQKQNADSMSFDCSYNTFHKKYHKMLRGICERFGFYDIFLIDYESGDVVYTVYKESDFATSLTDGPFSTTNLGNCFREVRHAKEKETTSLVDFAPYLPSYNAHASFMACPIYDKDKTIGVLAFQMPIENIDDIMTNGRKWVDMGLGKTGETYLVGQDFTLRNQSRFLIEDSTNYFKMLQQIGTNEKIIKRIHAFGNTVGLQEVKTLGTEEAIKGNTGSKIFNDYRGVPVLSAYKPLNILGLNWVIMSEIDEEEAFSHVTALRNNIVQAFIGLLVLLIILSVIVSRQITKPLKELTYDAEELAKGNFDVHLEARGNDEIGILADGFRKMQASISDLIHGLEDKVKERTAEVTHQKHLVEEKQKEIVDSINYAKRIQYTLLANDSFLEKYLMDYFVLFQPKDIVSGDFYWATKTDKYFYLAVCDSTGHGVPGAFMSLLNISFLNEAITEKKITETNEILNYVRERLIKNISKEGRQDGMDGVLLRMDLKTRELTFSGAHNAPVLVRGKEIIEYKADKMPIGKGVRDDAFTSQKLDVQKGDVIYLYTDGYADQFGGPKGKKFKYKQLNELLLSNMQQPLSVQREILHEAFEKWRGSLEQVDDVCLIGIRI